VRAVHSAVPGDGPAKLDAVTLAAHETADECTTDQTDAAVWRRSTPVAIEIVVTEEGASREDERDQTSLHKSAFANAVRADIHLRCGTRRSASGRVASLPLPSRRTKPFPARVDEVGAADVPCWWLLGVGRRTPMLRAQDLVHGLALGGLVDELVQVA